MTTRLDVPYLTYDAIAKKAADFLSAHTDPNQVPVPVDEIVDLALKIHIVPVPDLQRQIDVDGFSSPDFTTMYVDEFVYRNREYRFRFTLAHELGHFVLHREILSQVELDPSRVVASWKEFLHELDDDDHSKLEFQGYSFGGLLLVPRNTLKPIFIDNLKQISPMIEKAKSHGLSMDQYEDSAIDRMAVILSNIFQASVGVLTRRIKYDGLSRYLE